MRNSVPLLVILGLITLLSCTDEPELPTSTCGDAFVYNSGTDSFTLRAVPGSVWIELEDPENPEIQIAALFAEYTFLDDTTFPQGNYLNRFPALLKSTSCESLYEALEMLNQDEKIAAATPRLKPEGPGIFDNTPWILVNTVSIQPFDASDDAMIVEWAEIQGLELANESFGTLRFRVKEVRSGFEPLEIAIKAQNELDVKWALADFIVPIFRGSNAKKN